MRERPILFSGPMVRALLAGTKTETRRVVKYAAPDLVDTDGWPLKDCSIEGAGEIRCGCPYGQPGDRLWVRETWKYADWTEDGIPWVGYQADDSKLIRDNSIPDEWIERLEDIWIELSDASNFAIDNRAADRRWRPSIHMPRWASRITLELTEVRVERLQSISVADAIAEGAQPLPPDPLCTQVCPEDYVAGYRAIWTEINGPDSWGMNPWVWVLSFRVIQGAAS